MMRADKVECNTTMNRTTMRADTLVVDDDDEVGRFYTKRMSGRMKDKPRCEN